MIWNNRGRTEINTSPSERTDENEENLHKMHVAAKMRKKYFGNKLMSPASNEPINRYLPNLRPAIPSP